MPKIDSRAVVREGAELGEDVVVEPFAIVGPDVKIGRGTHVGSCALVTGNTVLGEDCRIAHNAVLGTDAQDLKYAGETTFLKVGDRVTVREFATVNRATGEGEATVIGDGAYIMAYAHVAHNCVVGHEVILGNAVNIAGHVAIDDYATVCGMTAVHQFVRVGRYSFTGGASRLTKDVPPYVKVGGVPTRPIEINVVGLQRRGFAEPTLNALRQCYRLLYLSDLNTTQALARIREELDESGEVGELIEFIEVSQRGIIK